MREKRGENAQRHRGREQNGRSHRIGPRKEHRDQQKQQGKPAIAGHKAVGEDRDQPFARGIDDPAAHHAHRIAAKAHRHGERLLAAGPATAQRAIQIEGHARQIAQIFQQRKQGKENRHGRQHG